MSERNLDAFGDEELLDQARRDPNGAEGSRAVSALLERYQDRVYLWCLHVLRDHERALDAAQEVLISAYRRLDTFEGRSGFSSWLFAIARNRCLSELRRPRLHQELEEVLASCPDHRPAPDQIRDERAEEERILNLIRTRLDPLEQKALWLRCYEGVAVDEIGRLLGLGGASGARGVLQRVRRKLRADPQAPKGPEHPRRRASGARGRSTPRGEDTT